jgi:hypothetical protein
MHHGQVKCYGTPLFLKDYYGTGFRFTIVKNDSTFNEAELVFLLKKYLSSFEIESNVGSEVCIVFPFEQVKCLSFLLNAMDTNMKRIGIETYGISSSTIEEVFIRVNNEVNKTTINTEMNRIENEAFNSN